MCREAAKSVRKKRGFEKKTGPADGKEAQKFCTRPAN